MSRSLSLSLLLIASVLTLVGSGCSALQSWKQSAEAGDVSKIREQRRKAAMGDFERRRSQAQLLAAQEHAERGDPETAEQMLLALIERDSSQIDARAQLAELYWAHEQWTEAEQQLREALKLDPERADLHHSLGLVLEARGLNAEAVQHLAKAVELEPENKLFRLAAEAATPAPSTSPAGHAQGLAQSAQSLLPAPPAPGMKAAASPRH